MAPEQRKNKRFRIKDGAFVCFSTPDSPFFVKLGRVVDIGNEGIAIRYVAKENETTGLSELHLFATKNIALSLTTLPCNSIYDCSLGKSSDDTQSPLRRCGAKFGSLSQEELSWLKCFIETHAEGEI